MKMLKSQLPIVKINDLGVWSFQFSLYAFIYKEILFFNLNRIIRYALFYSVFYTKPRALFMSVRVGQPGVCWCLTTSSLWKKKRFAMFSGSWNVHKPTMGDFNYQHEVIEGGIGKTCAQLALINQYKLATAHHWISSFFLFRLFILK